MPALLRASRKQSPGSVCTALSSVQTCAVYNRCTEDATDYLNDLRQTRSSEQTMGPAVGLKGVPDLPL